ncbi:MAG TPA: HAD family hydrolase [Verrucomicrobiae bacterium]|jgi:HAD superfamily hydrolase (TIGR01509 family)|nr:HAD family hydrolase [Verrucomicrobiae bacterium]
MRVLNKYSALLLDMNGTFMFGHDRFGEAEDFHRTYRSLGGNTLSKHEVKRCMRKCFDSLDRDSTNPAVYDDFPSLAEAFQRYSNPPESELPLLQRVFALHEAGTVSEAHASLLQRLARTHRLALVSNIWSPKQPWLDEFKRAGLGGVFQHQVFSSDFRSIKPSPVLFREALRGLDKRPQDCLFIGDSLRCDMEGACRVGIATAWLSPKTEQPESVGYLISNLAQIEEL